MVQAKRYTRKVGVKAAQEAVAAKGKYGCPEAMAVTNSVYTRQAQELAKANGVKLWDREDLVQALMSLRAEGGTGGLPEKGDAPDICAICQKPVSAKVIAYCRAHPRRFGGKVVCYEHQRKR